MGNILRVFEQTKHKPCPWRVTVCTYALGCRHSQRLFWYAIVKVQPQPAHPDTRNLTVGCQAQHSIASLDGLPCGNGRGLDGSMMFAFSEMAGLPGRNRETRWGRSAWKHHSLPPWKQTAALFSRPRAPRRKAALAHIAETVVWMSDKKSERLREKQRSRIGKRFTALGNVTSSHGRKDLGLHFLHQHSYRLRCYLHLLASNAAIYVLYVSGNGL